MILLKKRLGQSSIEFILIISVVALILVSTFIIAQRKTGEAQKQKTDSTAQELANLINAEIEMAARSPSIYAREFTIPETLNGEAYELELNNQTEITIQIGGSEYVVFLNHNVSGDLQKGRNIIQKEDGTVDYLITITALS